MKKAYAKYIITVSVLLLNIFVQLVPHLHGDRALSNPLIQLGKKGEVFKVHDNASSLAVLSATDSSISTERFFFDYDEKCEDDEDTLNSQSKNLSNFCISSFFHPFYQKYFLLNITKVSQLGSFFPKKSLPKLFIVFQVFRI